MQCTDQSSHTTQRGNVYLDGSNRLTIPAHDFAREKSEVLCSGQTVGFTGHTSVTNDDIETDGEMNNHMNGHFSEQQNVAGTPNGNEFFVRAKQQHEIKRKYLFTQNTDVQQSRRNNPKFRTYSKLDIRIQSFLGFVSICILSPYMFAKAGFFYKGFADIVACFQCGLTHKQFKKDDDPIIIHIQLKPDCPYITELINEGIRSCKDLKDDAENDIDMKEVTTATNNLTVSSPESLDPLLSCKVCLINRLEITIQPCGHLAVCQRCCLRLRSLENKCPICRGPIEDAIRTYMSE